jgi:hypothetical protein
MSKIQEASELLLQGNTLAEVAEHLCLDIVQADDGEEMIAEDGWYADDGNAEVHYEDAQSGKEAAELYADGGDWGDHTETTWVSVRAWREGVRSIAVECAWCDAAATAHDAEGDPACADHASAPAEGVELKPLLEIVECQTDDERHTVEVEPAEPECEDGQAHDWQAPHEIVGGIEENPGVWGHGGGVYINQVCMHCGCGKTIDTWAQNRETGEQGLTSVSYEEGKYAEEVAARAEGGAL